MSFYAIDFERGASQSREIHSSVDSVRVDVRRFITFLPEASDSPTELSGTILVVGHVRLDEEHVLASELGRPDARGLDLVARAYLAFGEGFERRLLGDFAFVLIDRDRRVLLAARDPSGVRPLVYRHERGSLSFTRDPTTLAAAASDFDERSIFDFLHGTAATRERTMFRGVLRLPPGHVLRATADTIRVARSWRPAQIDFAGDAPEARERFRTDFFSAVTARAKNARTTMAHVSGGLDSSSIAASAALIIPSTQLALVHAHFRDADELTWVRALEERLARSIEIVDATPSREIDDALDPSHPYRDPLAAGASGIAAVGTRLGAHVVLSGIGGDELLFERGVYRDLAAHGNWATLFRETILVSPYSTRSGQAFFRDALVSRVPRSLRALRRRLRRTAYDRPWIREPLRRDREASAEPPLFASHARELTWQWITSTALTATIESEERAWRRGGFELRVPFLDRRLLELVLSLPFAMRLPRGRMKALLRDSLEDVLPAAVRERSRVTTYDGAVRAAIRAKKSAISTIFDDGPWHSAPFVDRAQARRAFAALRDETSDIDVMTALWDVISLELWLRARL